MAGHATPGQSSDYLDLESIMLADLLPHRRSWLREFIDPFLLLLAERRYARSTLLYNARLLAAFGDFAEQHCNRNVVQLPLWVDPFVATMRGGDHYRWQRRSRLTRFIRSLQQQGVIPATSIPPPSSDAVLVQDYLQSLLEQRGLCAASVQLHREVCQALIDYLATEGIGSLQHLRPDLIHRFITRQGQRYCRYTLRQRCSLLRNFLCFLSRRAVLPVDLAGAVVAPRVYRHEHCPRFLTRTELDAVLAAINRQTPVGKRDHAMFLLLATYGLRGIEVVRLRLDDIGWREQLLRVRGRKAGNSTTYPLSAAVGEALLAYLQTVRPASPHREVFLTMHAPFTPLLRASLRNRVLDYLRLAGVQVAHPGTHSFRYSCAQRLFEQGVPLKSIGDFLGHRDPNTTERYTKIAFDQLREVASGEATVASLRTAPPRAGPLDTCIRAYLDLHRSLGKKFWSHATALRSLDRFLQASAVTSPQAIDRTAIERWLAGLAVGAYTRARQAQIAHRFFDHLRSESVVAQNPVPVTDRLPASSFKPFIFTKGQLAEVLEAARGMPDRCRAPHTYFTMLALLASLGLRLGEVRLLRIRDVDLERQALFIDQTKYHKSRYVPFGPKVGQCLQRYLEARRQVLLPVQEDDPVFTTKWRKPVYPLTLRTAFRKILGALGIGGVPGQNPPRLHDLRHTFAVHRLLRWYREGVDVQSRLPLLATFMGHIEPRSTEVYLTMTAELLQEANTRFHRHFGRSFDEEVIP